MTDYFEPLVSKPRLQRPQRARPALATMLIVLAAILGAGVFLESQHNVAATGSKVCNDVSCGTTVPGQGHSPTGSGSASGGTGSGSAGSPLGSGQSASIPPGADNPSASGSGSPSGHDAGSLALTGAEIALLVLVALGLLVAGIVLQRLSKKKSSAP